MQLLTASSADWPWPAGRRAEIATLARELGTGAGATGDRGSADPARSERLRGLDLALRTIQIGGPAAPQRPAAPPQPAAAPPQPAAATPQTAAGPLRCVHWNILKGIAFDAIAGALAERPELRDADAVLLNEVDVGMARSGNRHVAADLADRLGVRWAFLPSYLELTKGPGEDARARGENQVGFHGVAVLTRQAPLALAGVELPEIFDYSSYPRERRHGLRRGLVLSLPGGWVLGAVHLEVRNTPAARARQLAAFLDGVDRFCELEAAAGRPVGRVLIGGDLNTHTFARGTLARALRGGLRLALVPRPALLRQLRAPWSARREPLFADLERRGYAFRPFNDDHPSAYAPLATIDEARGVPSPLRPLVARAFSADPRGLPLRLDWWAGRGATPVPGSARTLGDLLNERPAPSDHAPIVVTCA